MNARTLGCLAGLMLCALATAQPTLTTEPEDQSVSLNATAQFKVTAQSSGGLLNYRWWFKDAALDPALNPSAAKNTLLLSNVTETLAGSYWVVVSDDSGSATSEVAELTVDPTFVQVSAGDVVSDRMFSQQGAWGDYDGDGYLDLAVVGGYNDTSGAIHGLLYHNDGAAKLVKVADGPLPTSRDRNSYLAWADADNDGDLDLAVGVYEGAVMTLYFNQGDGRFVKVLATPGWIVNGVEVRGNAVAWGDYDADGFVDLMVICWAGEGGIQRPDALLHNVGEGRFVVISGSPLALNGTGEETVSWVDYDGDGDLDFFSIESGSQSGLTRLFRNLGSGMFELAEDSPLSGRSGDYRGHAWADYDNDGDLDVVVCTWTNDTLFQNDGQGGFEAVDSFVGGLRDDIGLYPSWGDYDNDGNVDLFCTGGYSDRNRLFHNRGNGAFEEILTGSVSNETGGSWCGAWGDYDNDGYLDLFVANDNGRNDFLFRNNHSEQLARSGVTNHWLRIDLRGVVSNLSGIGAEASVTARISAKTVRQLRQIGGQSCAPELFAHFGLGDAAKADVIRIEWPSGTVQDLTDVAADQSLTITEHQEYHGTPPRFHGVTSSAAGCQIVIGVPAANARYVLEASSDLRKWTKLLARTSVGGNHEFLDTRTADHALRFYRLLVP